MDLENPLLYSSFAQTSGEDDEKAMKKAKKLAKIPHSCVKIVEHTRTISLPWNFINRVDEGIAIILDKVLCSYQQKLHGVPLARGKAKIAEKYSVIVEDQPQFHFPVICKFAIFRPQAGHVLPARVVRVDEGQIVCSVYGVITANIWKTHRKGAKIKARVGDHVMLKVRKVHLFRKEMQLDAELVSD